MMNGRRSAAFRKGTAFVVGITGEGCVLMLETEEPYTRRPILTLPSIPIGRAGSSDIDLRDRLEFYLVEEFGYRGRAFLRMQEEAARGPSCGEVFFLAPLLARASSRRRLDIAPALREVALEGVGRYLIRRSREGALVDRHLWRGCALAEEQFPQWAGEQLSRAIAVLETRKARVSATA